MQNVFDVVQTRSGNAIAGALVYVYNSSNVLATLYSDNGVTTTPNPLTTNSDGEYQFYAANGTYSIVIAATGYDGQTINGKVLFDPADAIPVSVKDYGAKGDGVTDDRAAFAAAIAAAAAINGSVVIPATAYSFFVNLAGGSLTVPSNISIAGAGYGSKITIDTTSLVPLFDCGTNDNIAFEGLHLVGNLVAQKSASSGSCAISASPGASNIAVRDCLITDWTRHGINLDGVAGLVVGGNTVERTWWGSGILVGNTAASSDVQIAGNTVRTTQQGNIQAYVGAGGFIISGNVCDGTDLGVTQSGGGAVADNITAYALDPNAASKLVISGNTCKNSGNNGIHIGGDNVAITGNTVYSPLNGGIFVAKASNTTPDPQALVTISGNVVEYVVAPGTTTMRGIVVRNTVGFSVVGNVVSGAEVGVELNGIDTVGDGVREGVVSGNAIVNYATYAVWLRNKVQQVSVTANSMSGIGTDIREDLVSAVKEDNWIYANPSSGAAARYAQVYRSTDNNILQFGNANGVHLRVGTSTASVVNYLIAAGNSGTSPPGLYADGTSTNLDLQLSPKGTGRIRFGALTASADAPVSGYIEIKDSGGTVRKLAVIA